MTSLWRRWILAAPVAASVCVSAQHAGPAPEHDFLRAAVGLRLGTLGLGAEAALGIGDYVNLRLVGHNTTIKYKDTLSGMRYDLELNLLNAGLILDIHTAQTGFRLSAGIFCNGNDAGGYATPRETVHIGRVPFTPSQIGTVSSDIDVDPLAYYFGVGFGNPVDPEMRVTVTLDIGVLLYASPPEVRLRANGSLADTAEMRRALRAEERDIEDGLISWWPVFALGISYQF